MNWDWLFQQPQFPNEWNVPKDQQLPIPPSSAPQFTQMAEMPRNPARAPAGVEQFAMDATVNPAWDVAKGVGSVASGYPMSPEAGAGLMAAMGMMGGPGRLSIPRSAAPVFAAEKGLGSGSLDFAQMLTQAGTNRQAFDKVFGELSSAKLSKKELVDIAQAYPFVTDVVSPKMTADEIKNTIFKSYLTQARFENKLK